MKVKIDNKVINDVEPNTLIITLADKNKIYIPRFCSHPFLKPVAICRQCLVEVGMPPPGAKNPKSTDLRWMLMPACSTYVTDGMVVKTNSQKAADAQKTTMEFLLTNHPLDCPVCDQGGECDLQDQAMKTSALKSKFNEKKRKHSPKTKHISKNIVKDMDRCVLCRRCVRFGYEISGDILFESENRGGKQIISNSKQCGKFDSNVVDICPVGALTDARFRFKARPFELTYKKHIGATDSIGSATRVGIRDNKIVKVIVRMDKDVNDIWITDDDRFAFSEKDYTPVHPQINGKNVSWIEAVSAVKEKIKSSDVDLCTGDKLTLEDAQTYKKLFNLPNIKNIDWSNGLMSEKMHQFLENNIKGKFVTLNDVKNAQTVVCVNFDPEIDGGILFLKMFGVKNTQKVISINNKLTKGISKLNYKISESLQDFGKELTDKNTIVLFNENIKEKYLNVLEKVVCKKMFVPKNIGGRLGVELDLYSNDNKVSTTVIITGSTKSLNKNHKYIIQIAEEIDKNIKPDIFIPILPYEYTSGTFINVEGRKRQFNKVLDSNNGTTITEFFNEVLKKF